ncbi:MAG: antibiotic biosynthesis monooxygenase [Planctomycetota bacterium]
MSLNTQQIVTSVFIRVAPASAAAEYERWLAEISDAAARVPGGLGTTVLRPDSAGGRYVAITSFDSPRSLQAWLDSPERAACLERLKKLPVTTEQTGCLDGVSRWFATPGMGAPPDNYKVATLLVLGLFPIVLALNALSTALPFDAPAPLVTLASLVVSVSLMVWVVMPWLTRLSRRWLHPPRPRYVDGHGGPAGDKEAR